MSYLYKSSKKFELKSIIKLSNDNNLYSLNIIHLLFKIINLIIISVIN